MNSKYNWNEIQNYCDSGQRSYDDIINKFGCRWHAINYAINHKKLIVSIKRRKRYDWKEIQRFYDDNHTWREVEEKFGTYLSTIWKATTRGDFKSTRDISSATKISFEKGRKPKVTEDTKRKISVARTKYLMEHPDKVPYKINHSSKKSWPEQVFEKALISNNIIGWEYAYRNGIYEYDFAWPDLKIDVEIDGGTHKLDKVKRIDERRDIFSKSHGWKVIRFEASRIKKDIVGCIEELKKYLITQ